MAEAMSNLLSDHGEGTAYARIPNTDRAYFPLLMCAKARTVCRFRMHGCPRNTSVPRQKRSPRPHTATEERILISA
jgi:hypothetical protein